MGVDMLKLEKDDLRWILARLGIILAVIIVCFLVVSQGLKAFNRTLGLDGRPETSDDATDHPPEDLYTVSERPYIHTVEALPEGPEASWTVTPCTLWAALSAQPSIDSLPEAPEVAHKPLEALLLVRRWAGAAGIPEDEIEMVYVFTRFDTIYVDLPAERDIDGLRRTIESRFICFTRLFPLVRGHLLSSYPEGTPLRGVEGVFRR